LPRLTFPKAPFAPADLTPCHREIKIRNYFPAALFIFLNDEKKLTGNVPTEKQLGEWIEAAKTLPKKVTC